jgi:hypothetical protein
MSRCVLKIEMVHATLVMSKCWLKHEGEKNAMEQNFDENPEIIIKLFDMMEKFTERFDL